MNHPILKTAALNALGTALYIALVASFLSYAPQIIGPEEQYRILLPVAMLLLFVLSAALTGFLVIGRPVLWYLDGQKKDALRLLSTTLGMLFTILLLVFTFIALSSR